MSLIALTLNLLLAVLMAAALAFGWRLNGRLKALKDSQAGFAQAVAELNAAAARAERGLADLRAASDEATDLLGDRIEKARALAGRLERLSTQAQTQAPVRSAPVFEADDDVLELDRPERLGALMSAAGQRRPRPQPERTQPRIVQPKPRSAFDDDLFEAPEPELRVAGTRR